MITHTKRARHRDPARPELLYLLLDPHTKREVGRLLRLPIPGFRWVPELDCRPDSGKAFSTMREAWEWADNEMGRFKAEKGRA